jgi:predicted short-subunit dehydrogenase-like oxidoreductase (DUF2520 family)
MESKKVVLIGSGNLGAHLAELITKKGHEIIQFAGRNPNTTSELSLKYFTSHTTDLKQINKSADIYIICVSDSEIANVAKQLKLPKKLVLHTSGTGNISLLKNISDRTGVLYPLQTFTKGSKVKWAKTPLLIEGNNAMVTQEVEDFALGLVRKAVRMSSAQRLKFHVAAVLACNFTNHLYTLSKDFLSREKVNHFDLLLPLINQTVKKIKRTDPAEAQTGPAIRGDKATIASHLKLLTKYPNTKKIYSVLSDSITASKNGKR